jgi:hypothetical protein
MESIRTLLRRLRLIFAVDLSQMKGVEDAKLRLKTSIKAAFPAAQRPQLSQVPVSEFRCCSD